MAMSTLARVAKKLNRFALGVDHFGKATETGTRGSSNKEGSGEVVLAMLGDKAISGAVTNTRLCLRKRNSGPNGEEYPFTPRVTPMGFDSRGKPLSAVVLDFGAAQAPLAAAEKEAGGKSAQLLRRILMTILAEHGTDQTPFADGPTVRACDIALVRTEFFRQYVAEGTDAQKYATRKRAFNRAVQVAQKGGLIATREVDGTQWVGLIKPV
jgi:hypothetical protein